MREYLSDLLMKKLKTTNPAELFDWNYCYSELESAAESLYRRLCGDRKKRQRVFYTMSLDAEENVVWGKWWKLKKLTKDGELKILISSGFPKEVLKVKILLFVKKSF